MAGDEGVVVAPEVERRFCQSALVAVSVPPADAAIIADTLVEADLRGVSSHGVLLLPRYVRGLQKGINPRPRAFTVAEAGSMAILDADNGMGHPISVRAMTMAIEKARQHGIGMVAVRNSNHLGALAYYAMMAVEQGMIALCSTNAAALMAPVGGVTETIGNNPICIAVPAGKAYPIVLDMATSATARNKIRAAAAKGEKIPTDWALDRHGRPTDDPNEALKGLLAPMAGVKGFGLAVALEALTACLAGGLIGKEIPRDALASPDTYYPTWVSHYFQAVDVGQLVPLNEYKARVDRLVQQVHQSELAPGSRGVFLPGEIEFLTRERRLREGIPIPASILASLDKVAAEIAIEPLPR